MQVIPAINVQNAEEAARQFKIVQNIFANLPSEALAKDGWAHLDIVDGIFSPNTTWGSPAELVNVIGHLSSVKVELHLMVSSPEAVIDSWLRTGKIQRVIFHLEAMTDSVYLLEKCKKYGVEAMLAINPGTDVERLLAHKDDFKYLQLLAVPPGWAGQSFDPKILGKIKFLRVNAPDAIIEVDGGINQETAQLAREAGADILISASYIFSSTDPKAAFEELSRL
ncbi:MAG: ribulose-phosphate 3-epimerase [Parcubacteria group bacterium Gr01-1014_3]|nr:MAG: ribulose-phosphate 3-epimerase [Parcubacteria group bacterium Gr01-1014_3]